MKRTILTLATIFCMASAVMAEDFGLQTMSAAEIQVNDEEIISMVPEEEGRGTVLKAPNMPNPALDLSLKLPFSLINELAASLGNPVTVINASYPVISRQGSNIVMGNINVHMQGMSITPTIWLRPSFVSNNTLDIAIRRVDVNMSMTAPNKSLNIPNIDRNELMATIMNKFTASAITAMDRALAANNVNLHARDLITFNYNRNTWVLRVTISPNIVAPLLPGLMENINLTGFSFDANGFALSVRSGTGATVLPGYNLAVSDGLITNFVRRYTQGSDFDLSQQSLQRDYGIKFRADGSLELAGRAYLREVVLKPTVYFMARITPTVTSANTIALHVERVNVSEVSGVGVPGFLNNVLQRLIVRSVVSSIANNEELARTMTARRINDSTVELTLKKSALLPSFANGVSVNSMMIRQGLMYLSFGF